MMDALPDGVLGHILGFLLAPEAVRTCVLARRWRQLWRFTTGLRVGCRHEDEGALAKEHREFLDHLLLLRGGSPLDFCEFGFTEFQDDDEPRVNLWFRHAVMCRVRVLKLHMFSMFCLVLDDLPLVSLHLTKLDLRGVELHNSFLNFSSCPSFISKLVRLRSSLAARVDFISNGSECCHVSAAAPTHVQILTLSSHPP